LRLPAWLVSAVLLGSPLVSAAPHGQAAAAVESRLARLRAGLFAGTADPARAIEELKAILAVSPASAEAHLLLGIAEHAAGSDDLVGESVAEFRQAIALDPALLEARFFLARVYLDLGRLERAREELTAALAQVRGHPQFLALLGETERQLGNPQRSVELNTEALRADPAFHQARYYLALALLDERKVAEATAALESVARTGLEIADVYAALGRAYLEAGRLELAAKSLEEATRINPALPDARIRLARVYRLQGLLRKADAQLDMVKPRSTATVEYQQTQSRLDVERGLLRMRQKRLTEAVAALRSAVDMDPSSGPAHRHLAEAYLLQGATAQAAEHAALAAKLGSPLPPDRQKLLQDRQRPAGRGGRR
jgi:tetratricopeptide (TPR) repeat protein